MTIIKEVKAKGIITKSNLPDANYVINPYIGCQHACKYCYAEFMKRFTNHSEPWGAFVDVKINACEVLGKLEKTHDKSILFSSVTDPYQPIEAKYKLTRAILQKLVSAQPKVEILTKSYLVTRDIDILKLLDDITVGVSLMTLDENISSEIEPMAAKPKLRLEALRKCKEAGLKTYAFISPIFPHITDIEPIIRTVNDYVDFFMFENLNLRGSNKKRILEYIDCNYPGLSEIYDKIFNKNDISYWVELESKIQNLCQSLNKEARIYFHHEGFEKKW